MTIRNAPSSDRPVAFLRERAKAMRRHMLRMSRAVGQGYLAQGLGIADALAAIYFHELRYDPANLQWPERDRFLLSTGHYSIALWAAFAEAGMIPLDELDTYGRDESRLEMSTMEFDARRRDDRRLARPRARPGGRHGARPAAEEVRGARLRRILRRRVAGRRDLRSPDGGRQASASTIWSR